MELVQLVLSYYKNIPSVSDRIMIDSNFLKLGLVNYNL